MISDVPIGFLSGGIDSSLIVSLMQEQSQKINTFTIGFTETDYNEAKYAKEISKILGTDHHEFYVSPEETIKMIVNISKYTTNHSVTHLKFQLCYSQKLQVNM